MCENVLELYQVLYICNDLYNANALDTRNFRNFPFLNLHICLVKHL